MDSAALKNKIISLLDKADERLLRIVAAVVESYESEDEVVAFTAKGDTVTRKQYVQNNENAVYTFNEGKGKSHDQLKKKYQS